MITLTRGKFITSIDGVEMRMVWRLSTFAQLQTLNFTFIFHSAGEIKLFYIAAHSCLVDVHDNHNHNAT